MEIKKFFKDWAIPGPIPPGALSSDFTLGSGETLDVLSGQFRIFQLREGHRFSTDDLLVAWYGTAHGTRAERVLELGSGIGSVAMITAWKLPHANFVTVEAQAESVRLAKKSVKFNGLEDRFEIREGDLREGVIADDEKFDLILAAPPYFPFDTGVKSDHPQKVACRFEVRGDISDYCLTAVKHLNHGGMFSFIFPISPPQQEERVGRAIRASGLSVIRERPVVLRDGEPPLLSVFLCCRATDLPEALRNVSWREAPLKIRAKDGSVHPEYRAVKLSIGFPP